MLVLSRKKGESVIINENIEIKIIETREGRIKLGIEAPKDVTVVRKEVKEVAEVNREAGQRAASKLELIDLLKETLS
ncbi:MAG: carbon storage regulator [Bacillota bacterium]|nr:carbon storage regulator [Bacillota bacterium]